VSKNVPGADDGVDAAGAGDGAGACPHAARAATPLPPSMTSMRAAMHGTEIGTHRLSSSEAMGEHAGPGLSPPQQGNPRSAAGHDNRRRLEWSSAYDRHCVPHSPSLSRFIMPYEGGTLAEISTTDTRGEAHGNRHSKA